MPEHSTWSGGRGGLLGVDRSRHCQFSPPTFARMQYGDFEHFSPGKLTSTTTYPGYTVTVVAGASTLVMLDRVGGWLRLLTAGLDNNGIQMQSDAEYILPAANRDIHFGCRIEMAEVIQCDMFVGLGIADATFIGTPPVDLIGFWTHDGDANLDFQCQSTAQARAAVDTGEDLAIDTPIELGFMVNGLTSVKTYINGAEDATFAIGAVADIPVTELALTFAVETGENVIHDLKIDWYSIVQNYI